jgi:hypothetical protein
MKSIKILTRRFKLAFTIMVMVLYSGYNLNAQEKNSQDERNLYSFVAANFDKESFLIGTLDDYLGRQQIFTFGRDSSLIKNYLLSVFLSEDRPLGIEEDLRMLKESAKRSNYDQYIDGYFPVEKNLALLTDSLFRSEFPDLRMVDNGGEGKCIKLYSAVLSKIIDSYFEYKPSNTKTIFLDTVFVGYHKAERLQTEKQKLSFLAGAFLRNGYKTASEGWYLSMPNSVSKAKLCAELLKELNCKNVKYDISNGYIPIGHKVYFEPSKKISELIKKVEMIDKNSELAVLTEELSSFEKKCAAALSTDEKEVKLIGFKTVQIDPAHRAKFKEAMDSIAKIASANMGSSAKMMSDNMYFAKDYSYYRMYFPLHTVIISCNDANYTANEKGIVQIPDLSDISKIKIIGRKRSEKVRGTGSNTIDGDRILLKDEVKQEVKDGVKTGYSYQKEKICVFSLDATDFLNSSMN